MKITALKACQMRDTGQSLIRIENDAGPIGCGEAGGPGPTTRSLPAYYEELLMGQNPLEVDRLWQGLMNFQHPNRAHIPTTSGIDIALRDILGKHYGVPLSRIYRGRFRDSIELYGNSNGPANWLDMVACREWAASVAPSPYGNHPVHEELIEERLEITDGRLAVPDGPGIGVTPVESSIKTNRKPGEPYWD